MFNKGLKKHVLTQIIHEAACRADWNHSKMGFSYVNNFLLLKGIYSADGSSVVCDRLQMIPQGELVDMGSVPGGSLSFSEVRGILWALPRGGTRGVRVRAARAWTPCDVYGSQEIRELLLYQILYRCGCLPSVLKRRAGNPHSVSQPAGGDSVVVGTSGITRRSSICDLSQHFDLLFIFMLWVLCFQRVGIIDNW